AEHRPQRRALLEHLPVKQRPVEARQVADRRDEAAAAVKVEGGVEAGRVDPLVVLVGAGASGLRTRLERLQVRPREPELLEPEQAAERARERAAGRAFDDLAE